MMSPQNIKMPPPLPRCCACCAAYGVGTLHAKAIAPTHLRSTTQSIFFSREWRGVGLACVNGVGVACTTQFNTC